jgi:CheY-like chemotaxis protein
VERQSHLSSAARRYPVPFLVWGALRFGPRGAASSTFLAVGIAFWATTRGLAPFALGTVEERLMYLYSYTAVSVVTSMLLAAIFAERARLLAAERESELDLLISDLGLPDGTGLDVIRRLSTSRRLPGIALSGYGMEDDVRRSHAAGFDRHLTKPVSLQTLEAVIPQVVRQEIPNGG